MKDSQIFSEVYSVLLSLGESFIRYIIELNRLNIFRCDTLEPIYKNNMNKVASITMDLYSKYSSGLYKIAKKIIDDNCVLMLGDDYISHT